MSTSSDVAELSDNSVYLMAQVGGNSIVECAERCCHANGYNDIERDLYCTWFAYFLFRIPTYFFFINQPDFSLLLARFTVGFGVVFN